GLLPPVRGAPRGRTPLRMGGTRRHGRIDRARVGPVALAPKLLPGLPDLAPDRRRDRADLPAALVLVADQRVERDRRHGDLLRDRRVLPVRAPGTRARAARPDAPAR